MTQKVVVAGATGFIGGHVAKTLVRAGLDAFALGRTTNLSVCRRDRGSACAVIDCAGLDPDHVRALKTAFPNSRYVLVSSAGVYRALEEPSAIVDEGCEVAPLGTRTDYIDKKLRCEELIMENDAVVVRPVDVVGPRDPHDRIQYWATLGREDSNGVAFCEPTRRIEFVDVRDLATLLVMCATNTDRPTSIVNARGPSLTAEALASAAGPTSARERVRFVGVPPSGDLLPPLVYERELCSISNERALQLGMSFRSTEATIRECRERA